MCVVSMVMDHWRDRLNPLVPSQTSTGIGITNYEPPITDHEIREFRKLLERAREYDKKHNEPDCEMESKKKEVMELAEKLGIADKLSFINE